MRRETSPNTLWIANASLFWLSQRKRAETQCLQRGRLWCVGHRQPSLECLLLHPVGDRNFCWDWYCLAAYDLIIFHEGWQLRLSINSQNKGLSGPNQLSYTLFIEMSPDSRYRRLRPYNCLDLCTTASWLWENNFNLIHLEFPHTYQISLKCSKLVSWSITEVKIQTQRIVGMHTQEEGRMSKVKGYPQLHVELGSWEPIS